MLLYPSGEPFSTGVITCDIAPLNSERTGNIRIKLQVEIENVATEAIIDTGGIYCILHPSAADDIGFDSSEAIGDISVRIRGTDYRGSLFSGTMRITAEHGEGLEQRVTVFVPNASVEDWGDLPSFLGLTGCLEFLRFAIDPAQNQFYFASV